MSDEIRAAAERLRGIEGPTFHGIGGKRHISEREYADAVTLARAYLAEHTPTPDGPPAPECRRCLGDHRIWSTNDETGRWLLCPECSGPPIVGDGVGPPAAAPERFSPWSFLRTVLARGAAIQQDYAAGNHTSYEVYSARLDACAREFADQLGPHLGAGPGGGT